MSKINNYELMWILSPESSDESIEKTINGVRDNISNSGGEISFLKTTVKENLHMNFLEILRVIIIYLGLRWNL